MGRRPAGESGLGKPLIGFPGHWAPNDLLFYDGNQFPERSRNGAFIAFHGWTIRMPYSQAGYFVAFVPLTSSGAPSGPWEVFADGFAAVETTSPQHEQCRGAADGTGGGAGREQLYVRRAAERARSGA